MRGGRVEAALKQRTGEHHDRSVNSKDAAWTRCFAGDFAAEPVTVYKHRRDAFARALVETVWLAQDQSSNGCSCLRGAIYVKPILPPHAMAACRRLVKRMTRSTVVAAKAVIREAMQSRAIANRVATTIERHLAG